MFYGMFLTFIKGKWAYFSRKSISLRDFTYVNRLRNYALWTMDYELWTMDYKLWTMDYGLWTINYGL